jgi:polar amino acid transport system substrate-binding protein
MQSLTRNEKILLIAGIVLLAAACLVTIFFVMPEFLPGSSPGAIPTPTIPGVPQQVACADRWSQAKASGKLLVGTSADYPPFEFYNAQYQIDGFDPALMRLIAQQLQVQVEFVDFAFEGLGSALQIGQIDAAISAISVTPEREAQIDFSNIYYYGLDAVLARQDSPITAITQVEQMAGYRVGVQTGTVYESYLRSSLVDTGRMPATNLVSYSRTDQAVNDLRNGLIDLLMLDKQPADQFIQSGGLKLVGQGLNTQSFAIAVCKGGTELVQQINKALGDLSSQGKLNELASQYLNQSQVVTPVPTATPAVPVPTATPAPPPPCVDGMAFVADLNLPDDNMKNPPKLSPGQPFTKGWRIRNTGTCTWTNTYSLDYAGGNNSSARMGGQRTFIERNVFPGNVYDIYVNMVAPIVPGTYQGFWQMLNATSSPFGQKVWVGIEVVPNATSTPKPTQTPSPSISFTADRTTINPGEAVTFSWNVVNASAVYFYAQGQPWQDNMVYASGSRTVYPPQSTTYELRVVWKDGAVETRQIFITVNPPPPGAPKITQFSVSPPDQITLGACVTLQWAVEGQVTNIRLQRDGQDIWGNAPLSGATQDCPAAAGQAVYAIEASGPGGTTRQQHAILVNSPPPTDAPTATSPPPPPNIDYFAVDPTQIQLGSCVNLSWRVNGTVNNVQLSRDGAIILDGGSLTGSAQDCPTAQGQVQYLLVASNNLGQSDTQAATVVVEAPPVVNPLENTNWKLLSYNNGTGGMQSVLAGSELTISFQADLIAKGSAGCNTYEGGYSVSGSQLTIGELAVTKLACGDPPGIMEQESAYLQHLRSAYTFQVDGKNLRIYDTQGQLLLEYENLIQPR